MVLPPWRTPPACTLVTSARKLPRRSSPQWLAEAAVLRGHHRLAQRARDARERHPGAQHAVLVGQERDGHGLEPRRAARCRGARRRRGRPGARTVTSRPPASRRRTRSGRRRRPRGRARPRSRAGGSRSRPGTAAYSPGRAGDGDFAVAARLELRPQVGLGQRAPGRESSRRPSRRARGRTTTARWRAARAGRARSMARRTKPTSVTSASRASPASAAERNGRARTRGQSPARRVVRGAPGWGSPGCSVLDRHEDGSGGASRVK